MEDKDRILEKQIAAERIQWDEEKKQLNEVFYSNRQRRKNEKQEATLKVKRMKEEEKVREKQHAQKMAVLRQKREHERKELQMEKEKIEVKMQKLSDDDKKKSAQHALKMAIKFKNATVKSEDI